MTHYLLLFLIYGKDYAVSEKLIFTNETECLRTEVEMNKLDGYDILAHCIKFEGEIK